MARPVRKAIFRCAEQSAKTYPVSRRSGPRWSCGAAVREDARAAAVTQPLLEQGDQALSAGITSLNSNSVDNRTPSGSTPSCR
jgi:hypothetical protein